MHYNKTITFHKWKKQLLFADKIFSVLIFLLLAVIRPDTLMMTVYILLYPYLLISSRKGAFYHLFISSGVALIWMLVAHKQYSYNHTMLSFFGLNTFPLFGWASGLFGVYLIYSHWEHKLEFTTPLKKMMLFNAFYWPLLIFAETIAYHLFNIKNMAASMYAGLPLCNCLHAPFWMQISYFALGPIYFGICELIGLENPHHDKKR